MDPIMKLSVGANMIIPFKNSGTGMWDRIHFILFWMSYGTLSLR